MRPVSGPIVPRRRLATELRQLRSEAGRSLEQVADDLMISTSKLSRLENAQGSPQARDVRDLIRHYGIEDTPLADKLMRWARAARRQGWWTDYQFESVGFAATIDAHVAYESEASVARVYTIPFIPALLQTSQYAEALYRSLEPWRNDDDITQLVQLRMRRQSVLEGSPAQLRLIAVAHECSIRQAVGSTSVMKEQLLALLEHSERPNVELFILPFSAPPTFASTAMWAHFEFGDSFDRDVVDVETHAGIRYIETTEQVAQYRRHYDELVRRSLSKSASKQLLRKAIEGL